MTGAPNFTWQAVARAQRYQVLVLSRLPAESDTAHLPLVWPSANDLTPGQTAGTQLAYSGPALQAGITYYYVVYAFDQPDTTAAQAVSASRFVRFVAR